MKMTVYFDGALWRALVEFQDSKQRYKAFSYIFGQEPKDADIQQFISYTLGKMLRKYDGLEINLELSEEMKAQKKKNPKRLQRELNHAKSVPAVSTKAQLAMKEAHALLKAKKKHSQRVQRKAQKEAIFQMKQEKARQKKRGH